MTCTWRLPSVRQEGGCRCVTPQAPAVRTLVWPVVRPTTLQSKHTAKAAGAKPATRCPSKQVLQTLNSFSSTCHFICINHMLFCCPFMCLLSDPCQPVNVSAVALCQSDSVHISWNQTSNAVNYTLTVTGNLGYVNMYNTSQTLLSAALPCGQDYNATLQAQGSKCYSLPSSAVYFTTSTSCCFTPVTC